MSEVTNIRNKEDIKRIKELEDRLSESQKVVDSYKNKYNESLKERDSLNIKFSDALKSIDSLKRMCYEKDIKIAGFAAIKEDAEAKERKQYELYNPTVTISRDQYKAMASVNAMYNSQSVTYPDWMDVDKPESLATNLRSRYR